MADKWLNISGQGYKESEILDILTTPRHPFSQRVLNFLYEYLYHKCFFQPDIVAIIRQEHHRDAAFQNAFIKYITNIKNGYYQENRSSLGGYFYIIFKGKCKDYLDKLQREIKRENNNLTMDPNDLIHLSDNYQQYINSLSRDEDIDMAYQLIDNMKDNCQEILPLVGEGYTIKEIAKRLSISISATKKRVFRCRQELRRLMSDQMN